MAMIYPRVRLVDGPLTDAVSARRATIERMAADLVRFDAAQNEQDAIRSLFGRGYSTIEIMTLLDEARQVAFQKIVAEEMSKP